MRRNSSPPIEAGSSCWKRINSGKRKTLKQRFKAISECKCWQGQKDLNCIEYFYYLSVTSIIPLYFVISEQVTKTGLSYVPVLFYNNKGQTKDNFYYDILLFLTINISLKNGLIMKLKIFYSFFVHRESLNKSIIF